MRRAGVFTFIQVFKTRHLGRLKPGAEKCRGMARKRGPQGGSPSVNWTRASGSLRLFIAAVRPASRSCKGNWGIYERRMGAGDALARRDEVGLHRCFVNTQDRDHGVLALLGCDGDFERRGIRR
jgi:hypothetical protein